MHRYHLRKQAPVRMESNLLLKMCRVVSCRAFQSLLLVRVRRPGQSNSNSLIPPPVSSLLSMFSTGLNSHPALLHRSSLILTDMRCSMPEQACRLPMDFRYLFGDAISLIQSILNSYYRQPVTAVNTLRCLATQLPSVLRCAMHGSKRCKQKG